jgi:hypothetical protein
LIIILMKIWQTDGASDKMQVFKPIFLGGKANSFRWGRLISFCRLVFLYAPVPLVYNGMMEVKHDRR